MICLLFQSITNDEAFSKVCNYSLFSSHMRPIPQDNGIFVFLHFSTFRWVILTFLCFNNWKFLAYFFLSHTSLVFRQILSHFYFSIFIIKSLLDFSIAFIFFFSYLPSSVQVLMAKCCFTATLKNTWFTWKRNWWADTGHGGGWRLRRMQTRRNELKDVLQMLERLKTKFLFRWWSMPAIGEDVRKQSCLLFFFFPLLFLK